MAAQDTLGADRVGKKWRPEKPGELICDLKDDLDALYAFHGAPVALTRCATATTEERVFTADRSRAARRKTPTSAQHGQRDQNEPHHMRRGAEQEESMQSPDTTPTAPATLAEALRIAIADGRAVLEGYGERYAFDALYWHKGAAGVLKCKICAAGAVMVHRLNVEEHEIRDPTDFKPAGEWEKALRAIDALRARRWAEAWRRMHGTRPLRFFERMSAALHGETPGTRTRLDAVGEFKTAGGFREFLDVAEALVLPILERCEREALAEDEQAATKHDGPGD